MLDVARLRVLVAVARHGSVTAAARELHFSQPSVSHHLARLEAETGAQLVQRVGRGIRLTEAGRMLADRAVEILGRIDSAAAELSAHVGLNAGTVRLVAFSSALATLVPEASAALARDHPGLGLRLSEAHPPEALRMLREGEVDAAIVFRYDDTAPDNDGVRMTRLLDDPNHLITLGPGGDLLDHRDSPWIAGCPRCSSHMLTLCARAGFAPRVVSVSDDIATIQALVAAGMGVAVLPALALRAHRRPELTAVALPRSIRHIQVATYGDPPDPPATAAVVRALGEVARHWGPVELS
jgi:molybdate transport repressor ModE-like protein